jgi:predicted nucleotidyltransferase
MATTKNGRSGQAGSARSQPTTAIDERLIDDVVRRVVERFNPTRVILFGSHARGDAQADSDLDLFIEMETDQRSPERAIEVSRLFGLHWWPMDILVYTPDEAARLRRDPASFINVIEAEGKVLYERK